MQVFALLSLRDGVPIADLDSLIEEEEYYLWTGVTDERVRRVWSLSDRIGGVAELEVESLAAAQSFVSAMPAVRAGLVQAQFFPVGPFRGFEVLFKQRWREAQARSA